ncbi:cupin domain-containing protein [Thermomonas carbonis]|uniref:cupin domain-containing protein n=1 Tax=Thermomonas carbonis TaxID=1463158 RepID=UPI001F3823FE|nr:cupin domain-containing protein [Thermomonas carbonis]
MPDSVSPLTIAASLTELWSPRVVADVDDNYVKVAKVHGTFGWHRHEHEDELFLVLRGCLRIEMEVDTVLLQEGELFVVPKGSATTPARSRNAWSC